MLKDSLIVFSMAARVAYGWCCCSLQWYALLAVPTHPRSTHRLPAHRWSVILRAAVNVLNSYVLVVAQTLVQPLSLVDGTAGE